MKWGKLFIRCNLISFIIFSDDDPVWDKIAYYLGACCANLTLTLSLEKIILGGGVMNRTILYDKIRGHLHQMLGGYINHPALFNEEEHNKKKEQSRD